LIKAGPDLRAREFLWHGFVRVQIKNSPTIPKPATQCNALHQPGPAGHHALQQLQHRLNAPAQTTRIKTGHKNRPKKTRCFAHGYLLAHALTQPLALRAAAYTQRRPKYFALTVNKPLDKSTHDIM
jgi:glucose-6-phosphate isomerase